jgi:hypothetical protein
MTLQPAPLLKNLMPEVPATSTVHNFLGRGKEYSGLFSGLFSSKKSLPKMMLDTFLRSYDKSGSFDDPTIQSLTSL